jgi:hypothetical protein
MPYSHHGAVQIAAVRWREVSFAQLLYAPNGHDHVVTIMSVALAGSSP